MVEKLGIEESKIDDLCNLLYKNYGTTMAGLRVRPFPLFLLRSTHGFVYRLLIVSYSIFVTQAIGYDFDYDEYHRCVNLVNFGYNVN